MDNLYYVLEELCYFLGYRTRVLKILIRNNWLPCCPSSLIPEGVNTGLLTCNKYYPWKLSDLVEIIDNLSFIFNSRRIIIMPLNFWKNPKFKRPNDLHLKNLNLESIYRCILQIKIKSLSEIFSLDTHVDSLRSQ